MTSAGVITATLLAAGGMMAGAAGLFDETSAGEPPAAAVATAPDVPATPAPVPEVLTVFVDEPAPRPAPLAVAPVAPAAASAPASDVASASNTSDDHLDDDHLDDDHLDDDDHDDDDRDDDDHDDDD
ncbi:MAG TPA: hypothetical protein VFV35_06230 [Acidimicrobiales bacterium]|nr:hypothetical protein [Acidimicrobiales bacterium]